MIHKRPLANYYAAVSAALTAHDVAAVPGLLTLMARDGYGDEAEELRRMMLLVASTTGATPESPEHAVALAATVAIWVVYAAIVFGVVIVLPAWAITKVMPPRRNNTTRRPSKH